MSSPVPLTPEAWAKIRYDYEHTKRPVEDICLEHGISAGTLRDRVRRWGWTPRWGAIPQEGPPAVAAPTIEAMTPTIAETPPHPDPLPASGEGEERHQASRRLEGPHPNPPPQAGEGEERHEPSPHLDKPSPHLDAMPIAERLQGAVARVLPAIEGTVARLAAGPLRPRDMELAARALGSLTRTLRELNGLLAQHRGEAPQRSDDELRQSILRKLQAVIDERDETPQRDPAAWTDKPPEDTDEFRNELARRIDALVVSREDEIPARYEKAWQEFAGDVGSEADGPAEADERRSKPNTRGDGPRVTRL